MQNTNQSKTSISLNTCYYTVFMFFLSTDKFVTTNEISVPERNVYI